MHASCSLTGISRYRALSLAGQESGVLSTSWKTSLALSNHTLRSSNPLRFVEYRFQTRQSLSTMYVVEYVSICTSYWLGSRIDRLIRLTLDHTGASQHQMVHGAQRSLARIFWCNVMIMTWFFWRCQAENPTP